MVESGAGACPGMMVTNYHFAFGAASCALQRGADGVYLFNECYREAGAPGERKLMRTMLDTLGCPQALSRVVQRCVLTFPQLRAPGQAPRVLLVKVVVRGCWW